MTHNRRNGNRLHSIDPAAGRAPCAARRSRRVTRALCLAAAAGVCVATGPSPGLAPGDATPVAGIAVARAEHLPAVAHRPRAGAFHAPAHLDAARADATTRAEDPPKTSTRTEGVAAVLMACEGTVTVERAGGERLTGSFGVNLRAGDRVRTGKDSRAEVMLEDGTWIEVGPSSAMVVRRKRTTSRPVERVGDERGEDSGERQFEVVQRFIRLRDDQGSSVITGLRGQNTTGITLVEPCGGRVRADRCVFRWVADDEDAAVRVTVYDDDGVVWAREVAGASTIAWPDDAPAPRPGVTYSWTVETADPLRIPPLRSATVFFEILPEGGASRVDAELAAVERSRVPGEVARRLLRASILYDAGLLGEAIAEMEHAVQTAPDNEAAIELLGRLYAEAGRPDRALETYRRIR